MSEATVPNSNHKAIAVDTAIQDLEKLIETHENLSRKIVRSLMIVMSVLVLVGGAMYLFETQMALSIKSEVDNALSEMKGQIKDQSDSRQPPGMADKVISDAAMNLTNFVKRQESVAARNISVLFVAVAFYVVVFGVLMTVYRHHLTEISKLQHYKIAFTRIRIAADRALDDEHSMVLLAAIVDRAFEYRSGKEKQIEGPMPGHPVSDIYALLIGKLVDALGPRK